jgi:hypothetical protein
MGVDSNHDSNPWRTSVDSGERTCTLKIKESSSHDHQRTLASRGATHAYSVGHPQTEREMLQ